MYQVRQSIVGAGTITVWRRKQWNNKSQSPNRYWKILQKNRCEWTIAPRWKEVKYREGKLVHGRATKHGSRHHRMRRLLWPVDTANFQLTIRYVCVLSINRLFIETNSLCAWNTAREENVEMVGRRESIHFHDTHRWYKHLKERFFIFLMATYLCTSFKSHCNE